jgi:hypothetical protein
MFKKIELIIILLAGLLLLVRMPVLAGAPAKKYDIKTFGAVGDGKTLNTEKMHVRLWSWWSSYG